MNTLDFPSLSSITDLQAGLDIISSLPLANSQEAHVQIKAFLDDMLQAPPAVDIYLELLEQIRPSLCFVAEDLARHFVNKPIPLGETEEERFRQAIITWIKMARSYANCAKLMGKASDIEHRPKFALLLHRCIYYNGMALIEHHRARRELPAELWGDLHRYYAVAEKRGVATLSVPDALDSQERKPNCSSAFLGLLLCELANPYSLSLSDQNLVRVWADNCAAFVSLHPIADHELLPPFVVDLKQNVGLRPSLPGQMTRNLRRLDTSRLAVHLKIIRQQLNQKIPPAKIGLGESCSVRQCKRVLDHVARPWTQVRASRVFPRRATTGDAMLGIGFVATHACISGKSALAAKGSPHSQWDLEVFPPGAIPGQAQVSEDGFGTASEPWRVADESANGFRLTRSRGQAGERMAHGQLLAVCPHDGERFLLAYATWLLQKRRDGLVAGVAALPGLPKAIEIRALPSGDGQEKSRSPAFMLPGAKPSLVLPLGWYQADRVIEITTRPKQRVRLKRLKASGADFEQVSFDVDAPR